MSEAPLLSEARSSAIPIQVASTVDPPCPTAVSPLVSPLTHGDIDKLMHKRPRSAPNGAFPPPTVDGAESAARTHRSFASRIQEALGEGNWGFQPRRSYHNAAAPKPLAILPLVALIFYEVSGGPFGTEDAVRAGSPFVALLAFAIFPLIWSIPEALVCAEMATIFPENSGYVAWVTAAFGPFWGWMEGFWSWVSGVTDNSVYPVLFMSYLETAFPALQSGPWRIAALVSFNVALTYMNWRGLTLVGRTAILLTAFTIAPFLVMGLLALPRISPANWLRADWAHVDWPDMLNIVFWNLNYWDSASTLAGEVQNPGVTFPRAIGGAVVLVVAMYLLPMLVGLGLPTRQQDWTEGYYAVVAGTVGGQWLAGWVIAAAAVSNVGQFQAEMSSDSFQLLGMAERGFLPAVFAKRSRHGTPTLGVLLSSLGIVAMLTLDFTAIVELLNAIYCFAELLEFAAFVHLRYKHPHLHRPYRVPLPNWAVVLLLLPASALLCFIIALPIWNGRWRVILYCSIATAIGAVLYPLGQYAKRKGWVTYLADPPRGVEDLVGAAPTHFEDVYDDEWATSTVTTEDGAGGDLEGQGLLGHARGGVRNGGAGLAGAGRGGGEGEAGGSGESRGSLSVEGFAFGSLLGSTAPGHRRGVRVQDEG